LKKKWFVGLAVLAAGAATVVIFMALRNSSDNAATIETSRVVRRDIGSTVLATGIIKPMVGAEVKVGSRISGVVKRLRANIGDYVEAGQLIAELEDSELQARVNQNLAGVEKARADLEYAQTAFGRDLPLLKRALVSQQQMDQSETSLKVAEALFKQAEANLEYARVQLSYAKIHSPISGVIASVSTQEGEAVSASLAAPTFVSVIDLTRLEVQVFVDETDIGKIQVGQEARFTVDTYADSDFKGTVTAIYPEAVIQDNVVNYVVTLTITDFQEKTLRPEMTTNVTIRLETRKNVLAVPTNAILREQGERYVTVMNDGRTSQRKVRVGWKDNGFTEIVSGLEEGETVVVTPSNQENE
jgi:macrolide-specific efflux system membrane fusion protein